MLLPPIIELFSSVAILLLSLDGCSTVYKFLYCMIRVSFCLQALYNQSRLNHSAIQEYSNRIGRLSSNYIHALQLFRAQQEQIHQFQLLLYTKLSKWLNNHYHFEIDMYSSLFLSYFIILGTVQFKNSQYQRSQMVSSKLSLLILLQLAVFLASCDTLWFMRNLTCEKIVSSSIGKQQCISWHQSTKMYFYIDFFHLCFPKGTKVLTNRGIQSIQNLQIGDQVLSYNFQEKKKEFSPVIGWISRDSSAISTFTKINTIQSSHSYYLSPLHNIARKKMDQKQETIHQFVFSNDLKHGDSLLNPKKGLLLTIQSISSLQMKGLFAPLIKNSNFFIYPYQNHASNLSDNMVLVHCYSQIKNPQKYEKILTPLLSLAQLTRDQTQDPYRNSIYTILRYFLNENWKDQSKSVRYDVDQLNEEQSKKFLSQHYLLRNNEHQLRKGSSSHSSSGHSSYHHTTSTSNRRRTRKYGAVKVFSLLSVMKNMIFNA